MIEAAGIDGDLVPMANAAGSIEPVPGTMFRLRLILPGIRMEPRAERVVEPAAGSFRRNPLRGRQHEQHHKKSQTLPIWDIMMFPPPTPSYILKTRHSHTLTHSGSQGTQEIQHMLLVDFVEPIELPDHLVRFRWHILLPAAGPCVGLNRFEQILCAPVV